MKHFIARNNTVEYSELAVLSASQGEKLTCEELKSRIDACAKDMHFTWEVVARGNVEMLKITRRAKQVEDEETHDLEMAMNNFLAWIDKTELPTKKNECIDSKVEKEAKEMIDVLLSDRQFEENRFPIVRNLRDDIMIGVGGFSNPVMRHILTLAKKAYDK